MRRLLEDSVRLQMRSDVPFGAYLSGGIDSSAVVSLMSEQGAANVNTFNLAYADDFQGKSADRQFAELIAKKYGTKHHVYVMTNNDLRDSIGDVLDAFDEPFSGTISTYFLTRLISKHVKVALSGDGADELFASYLSHRLASQPEHLAKIKTPADEAELRHSLHAWTDNDKRELFSSRMYDLSREARTRDLVAEKFKECGTKDPLNRALFFDFETLLPDQVLPFVDRLSMAHSVEVRPPFLDHRLIEFVATLPGSMKINNGRTKHILKEALADLLPKDLLDRPKEGFVLPVNQWLQSSLRDYVDEFLSETALKSHGLFKTEFVRKIVTDHLECDDVPTLVAAAFRGAERLSQNDVEIIPLAPEHLKATFEWLKDPARRMQIDSLEEPNLDKHMEIWSKRLQDRSRRDFAICTEGRHVGNCGLQAIDSQRRKAELWIYVSATAKGIGSKAINKLLEFGFHELNLNRIYLRVVADNPSAANFYEKLGFQREGVFRADTIHDGKAVDSQLYSMLRNEFQL